MLCVRVYTRIYIYLKMMSYIVRRQAIKCQLRYLFGEINPNARPSIHPLTTRPGIDVILLARTDVTSRQQIEYHIHSRVYRITHITLDQQRPETITSNKEMRARAPLLLLARWALCDGPNWAVITKCPSLSVCLRQRDTHRKNDMTARAAARQTRVPHNPVCKRAIRTRTISSPFMCVCVCAHMSVGLARSDDRRMRKRERSLGQPFRQFSAACFGSSYYFVHSITVRIAANEYVWN